MQGVNAAQENLKRNEEEFKSVHEEKRKLEDKLKGVNTEKKESEDKLKEFEKEIDQAAHNEGKGAVYKQFKISNARIGK